MSTSAEERSRIRDRILSTYGPTVAGLASLYLNTRIWQPGAAGPVDLQLACIEAYAAEHGIDMAAVWGAVRAFEIAAETCNYLEGLPD